MDRLNKRKAKVEDLIANGDVDGALKAAVDKAPPSKDEEIKAFATDIVMIAVGAFSEKNIVGFVKAASPKFCDTMIKYCYRGMEKGKHCDKLLKFHNSITKKVGLGCITRALVEKKLSG